MKRILVPTDFSECAASALHYAALIARKAEAEIVLVHACDLLNPDFQSRKDLILEYNRNQLATLRRRLEALRMATEEEAKVQVITRLYEGDPTGTILQAVRDTECNLIVMGTHGASKKTNLIFGSKTADVISKTVVPVMAVPEKYKAAEPKKVLLATNNAQEAKDAAIIFELAHLFDAQLRVVLVNRQPQEVASLVESARSTQNIADSLRRHYQGLAIECDTIESTDLRKGLQQSIEVHGADVLAMITHQVHGLFVKSRTLDMSYYTSIPLLAIPAVKAKEAS